MLIDCFHHLLLQNTTWMWSMDINVLPGLFIIKPNTRTECRSFIVDAISKSRE